MLINLLHVASPTLDTLDEKTFRLSIYLIDVQKSIYNN